MEHYVGLDAGSPVHDRAWCRPDYRALAFKALFFALRNHPENMPAASRTKATYEYTPWPRQTESPPRFGGLPKSVRMANRVTWRHQLQEQCWLMSALAPKATK
jgi:hypothetical protein